MRGIEGLSLYSYGYVFSSSFASRRSEVGVAGARYFPPVFYLRH